MRLRPVASLAWLVFLALTGGASAQPASSALPCVLDKCLDGGSEQPPNPAEPFSPSRGAVAPGSFDFYVLSLSWSPSFCADGGTRKSPDQCASGANPGFVLHGLWPQNMRGYPSACAGGQASPSRMALDAIRGLYPDEGLARHEWRQHGTCTGQSPTAYFADVRRARQAVSVPPDFMGPTTDATWTPLDIARRFTEANRGLRTDEMAVTCRAGALQEVRLCLSKDLRGFVPCPEVARASCRRPVTVPAGH
ncbi:ribonuclease T2 [Lichenihabitans sp. Uapishka_5]|uniref:ribonuclease T2 n=1 Tax=Lichenihabitans sp. Uapishka_5 TaxID=3037302 RepID=UPI0029E8214E|nr:ribonuclease T2 [Lichenihabitans sp. Uapishka_5]MDX7952456.1 ribonuclease T2 [Lichenihabitans sp. Uapishka_5]